MCQGNTKLPVSVFGSRLLQCLSAFTQSESRCQHMTYIMIAPRWFLGNPPQIFNILLVTSQNQKHLNENTSVLEIFYFRNKRRFKKKCFCVINIRSLIILSTSWFAQVSFSVSVFIRPHQCTYLSTVDSLTLFPGFFIWLGYICPCVWQLFIIQAVIFSQGFAGFKSLLITLLTVLVSRYTPAD